MKLTDEEISKKLDALKNWQLVNGQIEKAYSFDDFEKAMQFVNQVAVIAENLNHHPEIKISYNKVNFKLSTHSENGVTEKDFVLAKAIEQTAATL